MMSKANINLALSLKAPQHCKSMLLTCSPHGTCTIPAKHFPHTVCSLSWQTALCMTYCKLPPADNGPCLVSRFPTWLHNHILIFNAMERGMLFHSLLIPCNPRPCAFLDRIWSVTEAEAFGQCWEFTVSSSTETSIIHAQRNIKPHSLYVVNTWHLQLWGCVTALAWAVSTET